MLLHVEIEEEKREFEKAAKTSLDTKHSETFLLANQASLPHQHKEVDIDRGDGDFSWYIEAH